MLSRRAFIRNTLLAGGLLVSYPVSNSMADSTNNLLCRKHDISLPDLPAAFDGLKIAFFTDPHVGDCSSVELLESAVELASKENPDLVILGGDYVNSLDIGLNRFFYYQRYSTKLNSCTRSVPNFDQILERGITHFEAVASVIKSLNPPLGIIGVIGNHDRWNSADNCRRIFEQHGIRFLINQSHLIHQGSDKIEIYGSDDYSTGMPLTPEANSEFRILVSHNPDFLEELGDSTNFSIGLCGHTHGGQILLPAIGPIFSNIQYPQLIQGLNRTTSGKLVYTSAGIGTSGLPLRLNCPPELSILNLKRA